jgi:hypothetical protein
MSTILNILLHGRWQYWLFEHMQSIRTTPLGGGTKRPFFCRIRQHRLIFASLPKLGTPAGNK